MSNSFSKTRILVECALMIAIGTILAQIKVFELPTGGSITAFSMLPFVLVSFRHGVKWGLATGFVNSLLQILLGFYAPPSNTILALVGMVLLDYVIAFSALGLASAFAKPFKNRVLGVGVGTAVVCFLRFCCSFLSGVLIWGSYAPEGQAVWYYSLTYNGSYMLPELIITTAAVVLLYLSAPKLFTAESNK